MRKPLPEPGRGESRSRGPSAGSSALGRPERTGPRAAALAEASMLTTAALIRSVTSAKLTNGSAAGAVVGRPRSAAPGLSSRSRPPASASTRRPGSSPTRKVTADDSTSVMSVKRRDTDDNQAFRSRWRKVRTRVRPSVAVRLARRSNYTRLKFCLGPARECPGSAPFRACCRPRRRQSRRWSSC